MLPDNDIWGNAILAVIEKYNPVNQCQHGSEVGTPLVGEDHVHSIRVHRLAGVEIEVIEIGHDMFGVVFLHTLLELLDEVLILAGFLELLYNLLQISYPSKASVKQIGKTSTHNPLLSCPWKAFFVGNALVLLASSPKYPNLNPSTTSMTGCDVSSSPSSCSSAEGLAPMLTFSAPFVTILQSTS